MMPVAAPRFQPDDAHIDQEIAACLSADAPKSFFLFAGAGSGKTRSLVIALQHIQKTMSDRLRMKGQRVAVITFTNAASDEIKHRLLFDPLIDVRTIHSFSWSLIEGLNHDIREWLKGNLAEDLAELRADEAKGKKGTKASATRLRKIESKSRRLQTLPAIKTFTYSPVHDNRGRDALSHAEVLKVTAHFLRTKPAMQSILAGRHPILLIDESQDTNKHLVEAFFAAQANLKSKLVLGLLGDMMQRIYSDGKDGLGSDLPADWARPNKVMNHRCPKRVVSLLNRIRSTTDNQRQEAPAASPEGVVRLFILPKDTPNKPNEEGAIRKYMAEVTGDVSWSQARAVKALTLEHRMAASRLGFLEAFSALYDYESWRTSFLEGSLPVFRFFSELVLPLIKARTARDRFAVARIMKAHSPLLSADALQQSGDTQELLAKVDSLLAQLEGLWDDHGDPSLLQVLQFIAKSNLLGLPDALVVIGSGENEAAGAAPSAADEDSDRQSERDLAIQAFLTAPFSQVEPMAEYLAGKAHFDTHQGVKGLEFERVMVIMDDAEARGFSFRYEDLFGGKAAGDKTVEPTKRLFYVTASRAKKSLALVAYSAAPDRVRAFVLAQGWFDPMEIVMDVHTPCASG